MSNWFTNARCAATRCLLHTPLLCAALLTTVRGHRKRIWRPLRIQQGKPVPDFSSWQTRMEFEAHRKAIRLARARQSVRRQVHLAATVTEGSAAALGAAAPAAARLRRRGERQPLPGPAAPPGTGWDGGGGGDGDGHHRGAAAAAAGAAGGGGAMADSDAAAGGQPLPTRDADMYMLGRSDVLSDLSAIITTSGDMSRDLLVGKVAELAQRPWFATADLLKIPGPDDVAE